MSKKISLPETGALLLAARKIVMCCHVSPDGDTLGSALGLMLRLQKMGRETVLLVDDAIGGSYRFLPGMEQCRRPQQGESIEADLFVVIDASSLDRVGLAQEVVKAPAILNIDHHISNTEFADYLYLDTEAAATGEIICDLFEAMRWEYDFDTATCLYTAIYTDCGSFRYSNTTAKTLMRAAELLRCGVRPHEIADAMEMKSRATMELLSRVLATLTFEYGGRIAHITITHDEYDEEVQTDSFVSYPRYIEGVEIAVMFKAVEAGVTRVSMRSRRADVAAVALSVGGGGQLRAAGCSVNAPVEEAKRQVLAALGRAL